MQLGSYIKSRRLNLGLTHKQLAEKMDTTVTTISKWENNHVEPGWRNFILLCKILGINPFDFVVEEVEYILTDQYGNVIPEKLNICTEIEGMKSIIVGKYSSKLIGNVHESEDK